MDQIIDCWEDVRVLEQTGSIHFQGQNKHCVLLYSELRGYKVHKISVEVLGDKINIWTRISKK
jgi:hypothetical protein